jgi:nucleotide-binding universal stress UspA family protein
MKTRASVKRALDYNVELRFKAHGCAVSATEHELASVILQPARELDVDLLVLGDQHHRGTGGVFRSSDAQRVLLRAAGCAEPSAGGDRQD